jgi:hypothetical protein
VGFGGRGIEPDKPQRGAKTDAALVIVFVMLYNKYLNEK